MAHRYGPAAKIIGMATAGLAYHEL